MVSGILGAIGKVCINLGKIIIFRIIGSIKEHDMLLHNLGSKILFFVFYAFCCCFCWDDCRFTCNCEKQLWEIPCMLTQFCSMTALHTIIQYHNQDIDILKSTDLNQNPPHFGICISLCVCVRVHILNSIQCYPLCKFMNPPLQLRHWTGLVLAFFLVTLRYPPCSHHPFYSSLCNY